ncbi:hypothetical protein [Turneriella parva]|nr:hypothetical protein [Turneriella parva]
MENKMNNYFSPLIAVLCLGSILGSPALIAQAPFPEIPKLEDEKEEPKQEKTEKPKADEKGTPTEVKKEGEKKEADKRAPTRDNQLSEAAIDRTGQWIYEFERQFAVRKDKPEFEFLWGFNMLQEFHSYNNADLRKLNSTNDFQIRTTDDQQGLALTRAKFDTSFMFPKQRVGVEMSFGFDGVWGSFQLQGNGNPGTRIARANIFWEFFNLNGLVADVVMGRQFFSVGGIQNDYMLRDVLDAVVFNVHWKDKVDIKILGVDVYSGANSYGAGENDRWNDEFQYFSRDTTNKLAGLNGDVSTYRTGIVASGEPFMKKLMKFKLDPRVYAFYARVRGTKGGSDYSENGRIGNFSDNDWSGLFGARLAAHLNEQVPIFSQLIVYVDGAMSTGSDLRRQGQPVADYTTFGFGGGTTARLKTLFGWLAPLGEVDFFYAQGPQYDKNGNMISHGFISMRGDRIGGTLMRRYWGVRPSGYVGYNGIDDTPFDANRKSGVLMLHAGFGVEMSKKYVVRADIWHVQDTASTAVNFSPNNLDLINNPYVSRAELEAQQRFGKALGQEINLTLQYFPNTLLMFQLTAAMFIPGSFFSTPIEDIVSKNGVPKGGPADADFMGIFLRSTISF